VLCQRELMLARSGGLERAVRLILLSLAFFGFIVCHPIVGLKLGEELWIFSLDSGPDRREC